MGKIIFKKKGGTPPSPSPSPPITEEAEYAEYREERSAPRKKAKPEVSMPKPTMLRAPVPTLWHRGMAGVDLNHPPGPGERELDRVCAENGWTWAVVSTRSPASGEIVTEVLIGTIRMCAAVLPPTGANNAHQSWNAIDDCYGAIAESIQRGG